MSRAYTTLPYIEKPVAQGNFDTNRKPIVGTTIHTTDGYLAGTLSWFNNPASNASSTYVVDTNGTIYAMLEEYLVPYTNGNYLSNQTHITIECVDNRQPFGPRDPRQYAAVEALVKEIHNYYRLPINRSTVQGHNEVSSSHPSCPGSMSVDKIVQDILGGGNPSNPTDYQKALNDLKPILFFDNAWWNSLYRVKKMRSTFNSGQSAESTYRALKDILYYNNAWWSSLYRVKQMKNVIK